MALIYHPETQATVLVPDESLAHYRLSGWVTPEEWDEHLRLRDQAAKPVQATTTAQAITVTASAVAPVPRRAAEKEK